MAEKKLPTYLIITKNVDSQLLDGRTIFSWHFREHCGKVYVLYFCFLFLWELTWSKTKLHMETKLNPLYILEKFIYTCHCCAFGKLMYQTCKCCSGNAHVSWHLLERHISFSKANYSHLKKKKKKLNSHVRTLFK